MEQIAPAHVDSPFHFSFKPPLKNPSPLLRLEKCSAGYGETQVLKRISLSLAPGDRIGLLGPNGAGKSTLIKLLAGGLTPREGSREPAQELRIGYFAQHQLEQLRSDQTPLEHLLRLDPQAREQELRNYIGGFGFSGERAESPVTPFSGGEKARLVLALLVYQRPNLLLLDEPTNHLDLEMRHSLSQALQGFEGAMVIVSHDRHLLRSSCDLLLLVDGGRVDEFRDDLDDYPRWLAERRAATQPAIDETLPCDKAHSATSRKERKRQEARRRRQLQPLRNELRQLEARLDELGQRQKALEQKLTQRELYGEASKERLKELLTEKVEVDRLLSDTEEAWMEMGERLESAENSTVEL
jgi:ATP-binding cassette subfamily F protein 3